MEIFLVAFDVEKTILHVPFSRRPLTESTDLLREVHFESFDLIDYYEINYCPSMKRFFFASPGEDFREYIEIFWDSIRRQSDHSLIKPLLSCIRIPTGLLFVDLLDFWEKILSQTRK